MQRKTICNWVIPMTANTIRFEQDALGLVQRVREEFLPAMGELQLELQPPELSRNALSGGATDAEITMYVRRDDDIVDVIEFHIHRGGQPVADFEELGVWLRSAFEDVLRRQRYRQ